MMLGRVIMLVVVAFGGCAAPLPPPPPPSGLTTVTVAPVGNKTGSALVIAGDTYVEKWMGVTRRTVPDALARELEMDLHDKGFAGGSGPRLTVVLRRFEPDLPQLSYVTVSLTATLTDPDGTVRWTADRASWLVSTTGSPSLKAAYETAVHTVAHGLIADWQPAS